MKRFSLEWAQKNMKTFANFFYSIILIQSMLGFYARNAGYLLGLIQKSKFISFSWAQKGTIKKCI